MDRRNSKGYDNNNSHSLHGGRRSSQVRTVVDSVAHWTASCDVIAIRKVAEILARAAKEIICTRRVSKSASEAMKEGIWALSGARL
jgi:hypothetical protein